MSYSVTATFSTETAKLEGTHPINMYVLNASLSGWNPLYYVDLPQDVYGFSMNATGDLSSATVLYTGMPISRDDISTNIQGEIAGLTITIPNTDRTIEGIIQSNDYLRGLEAYQITIFADHLPSGNSAEYIGTTQDHNSCTKEKYFIDGVSSNQEVVTFNCKSKFDIKNITVPGRTYSLECQWAIFGEYLGSECFIPEQKIIVESGDVREIQDIETNDYVISNNTTEKVSKVFKRKHNGDILYIKPMYIPQIGITENHPIYSIKFDDIKCSSRRRRYSRTKWCLPDESKRRCKFCGRSFTGGKFINSGDLEIGDFVALSYYKDIFNIDYIDVSKILRRMRIPYTENNNKIAIFKKGSNPEIWINKLLKIDNDLLKLLGFYISEGGLYSSKISFCFNSKEIEYHDYIIYAMEKIFNLKNSSFKVKDNSTIIEYGSKLIRVLFEYLGGIKSTGKVICKELMKIDPSMQMNILDGIFRGDAGIKYDRKSKLAEGVFLTTTSCSLAWQVWNILARNNIIAQLHIVKKYDYTHVISINGYDGKILVNRFFGNHITTETSRPRIVISDGEFFFVPVTKIEKEEYSGYIYNLTVEPSNVYVAGGILVHNCDADSNINSASYPTCDGTLKQCRQRNNVSRFGGFPSLPARNLSIA